MAVPNNYSDFKSNLTQSAPPQDWPEVLEALWFAAKGDWEASHNIAQDMNSNLGSWIHAYLHRQEGDEFNAGYWFTFRFSLTKTENRKPTNTNHQCAEFIAYP